MFLSFMHQTSQFGSAAPMLGGRGVPLPHLSRGFLNFIQTLHLAVWASPYIHVLFWLHHWLSPLITCFAPPLATATGLEVPLEAISSDFNDIHNLGQILCESYYMYSIFQWLKRIPHHTHAGKEFFPPLRPTRMYKLMLF